MITYELAKKLKNKGYILCLFPYELLYNKDRSSQFGAVTIDGELYFSPTLSQLIEACGDKFSDFTRIDKEYGWQATAWKDNWVNKQASLGSTPEEAVGNLWLALNNL